MSLIEFITFYFLVLLVSVVQCITVTTYFLNFFGLKIKKRNFVTIIFVYMLIIKFIPGETLLRIVLLLLFLGIITAFTLIGTKEKKVYHVLSFSFSLTLCELTFATITGDKSIKTEYVKWMALNFLLNILFFLIIITIIKFFIYFQTDNNGGLTKKEYLLLSSIPLDSLIIICVLSDVGREPKFIICICLICINLCYIAIYDRIGKKNYEIYRFSMIEEQNRYYQKRIEDQQEIRQMKHDLKNILIHIETSLAKNEYQDAQKQLNELLQIKVLSHDEFTGCVAVDSILNVKMQKIREKGIKYRLNLQVPSDLHVEDKELDISAILGNLLDNAIEAVLRIPEPGQQNIVVDIKYIDGKLVFNIQNASNQLQTDFSQTLIKSEKGKERYGIGISSIKERVNRLHGYYNFKYKDGYYDALIVIPINH